MHESAGQRRGDWRKQTTRSFILKRGGVEKGQRLSQPPPERGPTSLFLACFDSNKLFHLEFLRSTEIVQLLRINMISSSEALSCVCPVMGMFRARNRISMGVRDLRRHDPTKVVHGTFPLFQHLSVLKCHSLITTSLHQQHDYRRARI